MRSRFIAGCFSPASVSVVYTVCHQVVCQTLLPLSLTVALSTPFAFQQAMAADLVIPAGNTLEVVSTPGKVWSFNGKNVTIQGTLRGIEKQDNGTLTGNGGNVEITGKAIVVGNTGWINLNAVQGGGKGGSLVLNGPVITMDGVISANGLASGSGGSVTLVGNTMAIGGKIEAVGGTSGQGGMITLNAKSDVVIGPKASFTTSGATTLDADGNALNNLITIEGKGVNLQGLLTADAVGAAATRGGSIVVISHGSGNDVDISTGARLSANSSTTVPTTLKSQAGNIRIESDGAIHVGEKVQLGAVGRSGADGGVIVIRAKKDVALTNDAVTVNSTGNTQKTGHGGSIEIQSGGDLQIGSSAVETILSASAVAGSTSAPIAGDGGSITLSAKKNILITSNVANSPYSVLQANGSAGARAGNGGNITFNAKDLTLDNNQPVIRTLVEALAGSGTAGAITTGGTITADLSGNFRLNNGRLNVSAANGASSLASGNAGTIDIRLKKDAAISGSQMLSEAKGTGSGGKISIQSAHGDLTVDNTSIIRNRTNETGEVTLVADNITNAGWIGSQAFTKVGHGGSVTIQSDKDGLITHSGTISVEAFIPSTQDSTSNGGSVILTGGAIHLDGTGAIRANGGLDKVGAQGYGGVVTLTAKREVTIAQGASIDTRGNPVMPDTPEEVRNRIEITGKSIQMDGNINSFGYYGHASGGSVDMTTTSGDLIIGNTGKINTDGEKFNGGAGGAITLTANRGDILVMGDINANGLKGYQGGSILLSALKGLITLDGALLSATGSGTEEGGSITLEAKNIAILNNSLVSAKTDTGLGGVIALRAKKSVTVDDTSVLKTGGLSDDSHNEQIISGKTLTLEGTFDVDSPTGPDGSLQVIQLGRATKKNDH